MQASTMAVSKLMYCALVALAMAAAADATFDVRIPPNEAMYLNYVDVYGLQRS